MSGLAGVIFKNPSGKNYFKKAIFEMGNLIRHRGPYKQGFLEYENVFFAHLNILSSDQTNLALEPMSVDDRYSIMLDGAIYNSKTLRDKLIKKKYKFFTKTFTELALNFFKEEGINSFNYLNGDWVICILDKLKKKLIIAKDSLGTKPIYLYNNGNFLSFCSEIKGFRAFGPLEFNYNNLGLNQLTIYNFNDTKFENIKQIKPGSYVEIDLETITFKEKKWFMPLDNLCTIHPSYEVNKNELKDRILNSIRLRLDSKKKIGTSLSGGIDSAIIFSIMNQVRSEDDTKYNLYLNPTIVKYDDILTLDLAKKFAEQHNRKLEIINSNLTIDAENLSDILSQLEISEEYQKQIDLYKKYKELGIEISIDGQAIDHFLGNPTDLLQLSFAYFNNIVDLNKTNLKINNSSIITKLKNFFGPITNVYNYAKIDMRNFININNFFSDYIFTQNQDYFDEKIHNISEEFDEVSENFNVDFQYTFFKTHYGSLQYFQHKWDKASMFSSVEMRRPYLDKNICYYILSLPLEKKIKNGNLKSILKDSFKDIIPDYILNQKFKQGLPLSKVNETKDTIRLIEQIINENNFNNYNWDVKKIKNDFRANKNLDTIWEIVKFYLMQKGFDNKYSNTSENLKYEPATHLQ